MAISATKVIRGMTNPSYIRRHLACLLLPHKRRKQGTIALSKKYQGSEELLNPKDGAGARTNECKQS